MITPHIEPEEPGDVPVVDWLGQALDCDCCAMQGSAARCARGHACVQDRYAKRIDRFFRWNPSLSNDFLAHPYFEVRAIACRRADVFRLTALIQDADETVRLSVAARLPQKQAIRLRDDPHREVRIRVAMRLEGGDLLAMKDDPDYYVRKLVAQRVPQPWVVRLIEDPEWEVRLEVAKRLPVDQLLTLSHDPELAVRRCVVQRLPVGLLSMMAADEAWEIRWEVAQRADQELARRLAEIDPEAEVRSQARLRLNDLLAGRGGGHG